MDNIIAENTHKIRKDFFRDALLKLIGKTNNKPIVVKAQFQWTGFLKQYCFRDPTPWLGGQESWRLCQHINIKTKDFGWYMEQKDDRRWFFLIGFPDSYSHFGIKKGCLRLVNWKGVPKIFSEEEMPEFEYRLKGEVFELKQYEKSPELVV